MSTPKPDLRTLKAILRELRAAGVTEYEDSSGLKIKLADAIPQQMPEETGGDEGNRDLELPDGVVDPVKVLERINRRKAAS